ncbi:MAG: hypothetical protein Q8P20_02970 [bacterium]|nr:hypothetical protein [bacterium]
MALEATHIKFAIDLKDKYQVSELDKYISGSVYPDSRYITGIDRKLTHNEDSLSVNFNDSDFKKGWACHFLCDNIGNKITASILPELFVDTGPVGQGTDRWVVSTAIKIIQDIKIFSEFNIQPYLEMLNYVENPKGEYIEKVKQYNQLIQEIYKNKDELTVKDSKQLLLSFGIENEFIDRIIIKTNTFLKDTILTEKIHSIYNEMVRLGLKHNID